MLCIDLRSIASQQMTLTEVNGSYSGEFIAEDQRGDKCKSREPKETSISKTLTHHYVLM